MPGKLKRQDYDLVEEVYDSKIPVHNETAFEHGIRFKVKFIGTKEIAKPSSRAEIVAAMRRIRYEYKLQGMRKKIVQVCIGLEGVRVIHQHTKGSVFQKKKMKEFIETELASYPIHKIFYVSHDSQDLQIFSYIAKEEDIFKCSVFKASNKSQAVHIVRTIGQAFEVCHKRIMSPSAEAGPKNTGAGAHNKQNNGDTPVSESEPVTPEKGTEETTESSSSPPESSQLAQVDRYLKDGQDEPSTQEEPVGLSVEKLRQIFQQQVDHHKQEAAAATLHTKLLTDKLMAETSARTEAQKQLEAVLKQNKELISTVQQLVSQVHSLHAQRFVYSTNSPGINLTNRSTSSSLSSTPILPPKDVTGPLRRHLGEPMLPHIPPPTITPSPSHSRHNSNASTSSFMSGAKASSLDKHDALPSFLNASTSDLELSPSKREPPPQQFLQFVFDSSVHSDYFMASESTNNVSAAGEHARWPNESSQSVSMTTQNGSLDGQSNEKKQVVNGT